MSLLEKQEVQDIREQTALRARKWSGFICKRASEDRHYRARSTEERTKRKQNAKLLFFTSRGTYINCAIIAKLYTHSIGNQP